MTLLVKYALVIIVGGVQITSIRPSSVPFQTLEYEDFYSEMYHPFLSTEKYTFLKRGK